MESEKENGLQLEQEVFGEPDAHEDHSRKLERYTKAKNRALELSEYILKHRPGMRKWAATLQSCGSFLKFRYYFNKNIYRLINGCFCQKHLLCSLCAIRRAAKQLQAYLSKAHFILQEHPNLKLVLVTITVKNGEDLLERFYHLQGNYQRLVERRRNVKKGKKTDTVFKHFEGAVTTYEFTNQNKGKFWHPHIHMLALVSKDFDCTQGTQKLKSEWEKLTSDSHQCDIRPIESENDKSFLKSFIEVFKYTVKFNDMSLEHQAEAAFKLRQKRLISAFGLFYGVKISDDLNDTIEDELKLEPYIEMIYRYSGLFGYQLTDSYHGIGTEDQKELKKQKLLELETEIVPVVPEKQLPQETEFHLKEYIATENEKLAELTT